MAFSAPPNGQVLKKPELWKGREEQKSAVPTEEIIGKEGDVEDAKRVDWEELEQMDIDYDHLPSWMADSNSTIDEDAQGHEREKKRNNVQIQGDIAGRRQDTITGREKYQQTGLIEETSIIEPTTHSPLEEDIKKIGVSQKKQETEHLERMQRDNIPHGPGIVRIAGWGISRDPWRRGPEPVVLDRDMREREIRGKEENEKENQKEKPTAVEEGDREREGDKQFKQATTETLRDTNVQVHTAFLDVINP